jgi:phenylacetate-CoA ligase
VNQHWQALYERTPILAQELVVSLYGLATRRRRFDAGFEARLAWLRDAERWPLERQIAYQEERLREIAAAAYEHVAFYRRRMSDRGLRATDLRSLADLAKLPVLRRNDVHEHREEMVSRLADRRSLVMGHTSGTTGSPLEFWWDRNVEIWNNTMLYRARGFAGYRFGDRTATLLGNVIVPLGQQEPPFWRRCLPWNKVFFSSFHLNRRHLPSYVAELSRLSPLWLEAYPSTAYVLAQYLEDSGTTLGLSGVFLSSETLTTAERESIESRFTTRVWDAYSMSERVIFSAECEAHDGHHLFPEFGIVEVLDVEDRPVPPGQTGRLVATGLQNLAMPLIRYDTGDIGGFDPRPCACGRTLPKLLPVTTKAEDVVVTPEGRWISASVLTHPFKPMQAIERSQIIQETVDALTVRIVRRPEYEDHDSERLIAGLRARLGPQMRITLEFVEDIPRTASGKYRWVISRVPLGLGSGSQANLFSASVG